MIVCNMSLLLVDTTEERHLQITCLPSSTASAEELAGNMVTVTTKVSMLTPVLCVVASSAETRSTHLSNFNSWRREGRRRGQRGAVKGQEGVVRSMAGTEWDSVK